jgi:hypothetical protein
MKFEIRLESIFALGLNSKIRRRYVIKAGEDIE